MVYWLLFLAVLFLISVINLHRHTCALERAKLETRPTGILTAQVYVDGITAVVVIIGMVYSGFTLMGV